MQTLPPTYKGGLISITLHDLITLMNLPIGTLGTNKIQYMKYTSEYILKLQIHQQLRQWLQPEKVSSLQVSRKCDMIHNAPST